MFRRRRNREYLPIRNTIYSQELLNDNKDEAICKIFGYVHNNTHTIFYHLVGVLLLGVPYLLARIYPKLGTTKYAKSALDKATILLVCDNHGQIAFIDIRCERVRLRQNEGEVNIRYFIYQHTKYVWINERQEFSTLDVLIPLSTVDDYLKDINGLSEIDYNNRLQLYGQNKIEVEIKSYWMLFVEEVFNPFYMFQAFSVILWLFDDYISYAFCVIVLTLFSSITALIQTRRQSEALHDLVESSKCHEVTVLRHNHNNTNVTQLIDPIDLVPGDLIVLPAGNFILPCDAVLLTGQCIVNESVLTGESVPVTKTSLHSSPELYDTNLHKRHTLFSGTHMLQTRYYGGEMVLARVIRTGFDTTKGSLVKSILFPVPVGLKFYRDSFKFVFFLFAFAAVGMGYCLHLYVSRAANTKRIVLRTLDIITIVVPPALPAAMAVGTVYSQSRLKKIGIFCISPPRINVCGKIKLACFDKTGTLTEDGLNMKCVLSSNNATFSEEQSDICVLGIHSQLVQAMATCHSLTRIGGELNGDPLDLNMFEFTCWELEESGDSENNRYDVFAPTVVKPKKGNCKQLLEKEDFEDSYQIGVLRQFTFSSTLQCMSVICRVFGSPNMVAFTKGAPEKLHDMCLPETLPPDFDRKLSMYTTQGYRVIAVGYKELPRKFSWKEMQKCKRDVIECDLRFLGLLIMQNPLKKETTPVIKVLQEAGVRTVMITGDNILTAISVSRDCGMVKHNEKIYILKMENGDDPNIIPSLTVQLAGSSNTRENVVIDMEGNAYHFAVEGKTWAKIRMFYLDLIPHLLVRTTIFARFQPDQKTQVVSYFQTLDYIVSMVGDGANDCGALKAAHVGVSLSQAEASVAAPFTSSIENISCLVNLIQEGRCAIVTSFAIFKYMAMYSLIQFITTLILYRHHSILGDHQFLFIDLVITTSLAVTIGRQGPSNKLGVKRPMGSLVAAKNLIPIILQIIVCALIQAGALSYLYQQEWFKPIPSGKFQEVILCWENTVLFTVSCYQYIILATAYSKGRPYRQMLITNFWFLVSAVGLTCFITVLLVRPNKFLAELMQIMFLPHKAHDQNHFRLTLLAFPICHFILVLIIEELADREWLKKLIQCLKCKQHPKNKYKLLLKQNCDELVHIIDSSRS